MFRTRLTDVLMMIALLVVGSVQKSIIAGHDEEKDPVAQSMSPTTPTAGFPDRDFIAMINIPAVGGCTAR